MSKEGLVYQAESDLKRLAENNFKLLFTTDGFRFLGIVTYDRKKMDESLGVKRRWIQGLRFDDGDSLPNEERVFETSLHRKNPLSGQLDDIVVHEDDLMILMERNGFELSDADENFHFMANMHWMNRTQQLLDEIEANQRRIGRLKDEKEEMFLDTEHFRQEAQVSKEKSKTNQELVNRLSRENATLQEQIGNLQSLVSQLRQRNLVAEAYMEEQTANATETGSVLGMTTDDQILHAISKKAEIYKNIHEIEPEGLSIGEQMEDLSDAVYTLNQKVDSMIKQSEPQEKQKQGQGAQSS